MKAMLEGRLRGAHGGRNWWSAWVLVAALAATPLAAQEGEVERSCRCVDARGEEIENCTCMRALGPLRLEGGLFGSLFERRSQIGVWIEYDQGDDADRRGARIERVREGGPAAQAGLRAGDLVVRVDGRSVFDPLPDADQERTLDEDQSLPVQRFVRLVGGLEPGEEVALEVLRDGRTVTVRLTPEEATGLSVFGFGDEGGGAWRFDLDELRGDIGGMERRLGELHERGWTEEGPGVFRFEGPGRSGELRFFADSLRGRVLDWDSLQGGRNFFEMRRDSDPCFRLRSGGDRPFAVLGLDRCVAGVEFIELNPELGEYFGTAEGALVAAVAEGSPLGLRAGDVLLAIDGREVQGPEHARRILASYRDDEDIRLRVLRKGDEIEVRGRRQ